MISSMEFMAHYHHTGTYLTGSLASRIIASRARALGFVQYQVSMRTCRVA
jgi:hypothetical protein